MMATQRPQTLPPIWERSTKKTTKVHVYVNGDRHYPGREVNIFKRSNFDTWLDDLTWMFKPRKGRFCRVYTPTAGHRVNSLESLQDGDKVVAACRSEKFEPVGYEGIARNLRKRPPNNLDVEAGHRRQHQVSSRYKKVDTVGIIIHVSLNGQTVNGAKHLLLRPNRPASLPYVLDCVSDAYKLPRSEAIDRLFVLPTGEEVRGLEQIKANSSYVACRKGENFLHLEYRENPRPNILTSPRLEKKQLPRITRGTKAGIQSSPEHSISSNNGSENSYTQRYRRERAKREEDGVFHHRPVKHKRSSEKARQTDYDQDNGGVFKARQQNQATRGARQVEETANTRTELPLDQRPTEEVKEEVKKKDKKDKKGKKQAQAARQQAAEREKERQQQEREKKEREKKERQQQEREKEREERQQQEREKERQQQEREEREKERQQQEREKKEREKKERQQQEREKEREERQQQEREKKEREKKEREKKEREKKEREKKEREEVERREEETAKYNQESPRDAQPERPPQGSPYRSGTELLTEHDPHPLPHTPSPQRQAASGNQWDHTPAPEAASGNQWDHTPTPEAASGDQWDHTPKAERDSARGHNSGPWGDEAGQNHDQDPVDWGLGPEETETQGEEEERERAAITIQAHYRGMKARQHMSALRAQTQVKV